LATIFPNRIRLRPQQWSGEFERSSNIAHFPASGRTLEERSDVRVIPLGSYPYRLFYTVSGGEMIILHIRHSAREPVDSSEL
jgi:hypothetical protein